MIPEFAIQSALDAQQSGIVTFVDQEGNVIGHGDNPSPAASPASALEPAQFGPPAAPSQGLSAATEAALRMQFGGQPAPALAPQLAPVQPPQPALASPQSPMGPSAVPEQPPVDQGQVNLAGVIGDYARGSQSVIPGGIRKTAEQWQQAGPAPVPSADPRTAAANAAAYNEANTERTDAENEALLDRRMSTMLESERQDIYAGRAYLDQQAKARIIAENEQQQQQRAAAIDSEVSKLESLLEKRSKVTSENPVERYYQKQGTWGRIVNAISLGLGAAGQALAGGQNVGLELMNREIDGEIARQRQLVDDLGIQVSARRTILGEMLMKFKSPEAAENATRYAMLGIAEDNLRYQAAKEKSAVLKAGLDDAANSVALERAGLKEKSLSTEHVTRWNDVPARVVGNAGGIEGLKRMLTDLGFKPGTPQYQQAMTKAIQGGPNGMAQYLGTDATAGKPTDRNEVAVAEFMMKRRIDIPEVLGGGQGYTVPGAEKDVREGINAAANIIKNINRLEKIVTTETVLSPTTQALIKQIGAEGMGAWRTKLGLGVMSESDKELVKPLTGEFIGEFKNAAITDRLKILNNVKSLTQQTIDEYRNQLYRDPMATEKMRDPIRTRAVQ
jgi:hypothetical protein